MSKHMWIKNSDVTSGKILIKVQRRGGNSPWHFSSCTTCSPIKKEEDKNFTFDTLGKDRVLLLSCKLFTFSSSCFVVWFSCLFFLSITALSREAALELGILTPEPPILRWCPNLGCFDSVTELFTIFSLTSAIFKAWFFSSSILSRLAVFRQPQTAHRRTLQFHLFHYWVDSTLS